MDQSKLNELKELATNVMSSQQAVRASNAGDLNMSVRAMAHLANFELVANPPTILELIADYEDLRDILDRVDEDLADESAKVVMLEKEVNWLAKHGQGEDQCPYMAFQWGDPPSNKRPDWCVCTDTPEDGFDCGEDPVECWRRIAKEAVKN